MKEFVAFSWNLENCDEKKSHSVATEVMKTVERSLTGYDCLSCASFIGFFLEVIGDLPAIKVALKKQAQERELLKDVKFEFCQSDGLARPNEGIIYAYRGLAISTTTLDLQSEMKEFISLDDKQSKDLLDNAKDTFRTSLRSTTSLYKAKKVEHYQNPKRRPHDWFRNGIICEVRDPANVDTADKDDFVRVGSLHAPGPDISGHKSDFVLPAVLKVAAKEGVDIVIGDFNRVGNIRDSNYASLSGGWQTGSTLGKKDNLHTPGEKCWDNVFADEGIVSKCITRNPAFADRLLPQMSGSLDGVLAKPNSLISQKSLERVSDHGLVSVKVNATTPAELRAVRTNRAIRIAALEKEEQNLPQLLGAPKEVESINNPRRLSQALTQQDIDNEDIFKITKQIKTNEQPKILNMLDDQELS